MLPRKCSRAGASSKKGFWFVLLAPISETMVSFYYQIQGLEFPAHQLHPHSETSTFVPADRWTDRHEMHTRHVWRRSFEFSNSGFYLDVFSTDKLRHIRHNRGHRVSVEICAGLEENNFPSPPPPSRWSNSSAQSCSSSARESRRAPHPFIFQVCRRHHKRDQV